MVKLNSRLGLAGAPPMMDSQRTLKAADQVVSCVAGSQGHGSLHIAAAEKSAISQRPNPARLTPSSWER